MPRQGGSRASYEVILPRRRRAYVHLPLRSKKDLSRLSARWSLESGAITLGQVGMNSPLETVADKTERPLESIKKGGQ